MDKPFRPVIRQPFLSFAFNVTVAAKPIASAAQQSSLSSLYTTILFSVPSTGAPIIVGDAAVLFAAGNGIEIPVGVPTAWKIENIRQMYEVQAPLVALACGDMPEAIPFVTWDVSSLYIASAAPQRIGIMLFSEGFK